MRYAVGFVLALALVASPLRMKAQAAGGDSLSSWQTYDRSTSRSISKERRGVRNAAIGLGVSSAVFSIGVVVTFAGLSFGDCGEWSGASSEKRQQCDKTALSGVALSAVGAIGMITSGVLFGKRKDERDRSRQARVQTLRRVQWDLARSRLVF